MNKIKILASATLLILVAVSCTKEYLFFDKDTASVKFIYSSGVDSTVYSFALHPGVDQDTVHIPLQILGFTKEYAREVTFAIDEERTTAVPEKNFKLLHCEIAENASKGELKLIVRRTEQLAVEDLRVRFKLLSNTSFSDAPLNESGFSVILSNRLMRPSDWPGPFGAYSRRKHEFVIETIQIGTNYRELNPQQIIYYVGILTHALYEYNKANPGQPMVDEENMPISF